MHALVTGILPYQVTAKIGDRQVILTTEDWAWTGFHTADQFLHIGDLIYVKISGDEGGLLRATLEEDTGVQAALFAIDNTTGDVLALVGGRDFNLSQFDRATQAERQTGSSFKPYVYTTAVQDGMTPQDTIIDKPVSFGNYVPHNYDNKFKGRISLLEAFADSRNIPALEIADRVGIRNVIATAHRFGITTNIPAYLPVALGSAEVTLEQQVDAYSVFPNDGIRIAPRLVRRVVSADGVPLYEASPDVNEVISQKVARTMMVFFQGVTSEGTAARLRELNHPLGGKTGTTNDFTDAWFIGFSPSITCGVWGGYDDRQSLGDKQTGAAVALPLWTSFMKTAIAATPNENFPGETSAPRPSALRQSAALAAH
jgi:penicillin-binding protein 1A